MTDDTHQERLRRLRQHRVWKEPDLSLGFLEKQFQRDVAKPHKQLGALSELWRDLVPDALVGHTRLDDLSRGILRVSVDSSAHLYELDRLLRSGLEKQLVRSHRGAAFRRIKLRVIDEPLAGGDA